MDPSSEKEKKGQNGSTIVDVVDVVDERASHTTSSDQATAVQHGGQLSEKPKVTIYDPSKETVWTRIGISPESFKRAPGPTGEQLVQGHGIDPRDIEGDMPTLQPKMKTRHLNMIAVGGSIGTGLFVTSGEALRNGGPGGVLVGWLLTGLMLINVTQALGEMSILYPVSGGFYTLAIRFLDPSFAFAMGWNYVFQWAAVLPLEITVAVKTVNYWNQNVPPSVWVTIFFAVIIILSVFGTLGFAEEEFWSSCLKLLVILMFIFIGIICVCGGGPKSGEYGEYVGGRYWQNPGAFSHGFKGVCSVFVTAAFSLSGTELVGLAASETKNPRQTMPGAVKQTFWRIIVIFVVSLTLIGLLIPYTEPDLLGGSNQAISPFVLVIKHANISGLDDFINVTICISVLSIGLSCVYAGSRTLTALAETGFAPKIFAYVDKSSRPLPAVIAILIFGPIAYVNSDQETADTVFKWLLAISSLSTIITWMSILLCHIRFRAAWKAQGHSLDELPFKAMGGVWGSWFGVLVNALVLIAQFYVAIFPVGKSVSGADAADSFFSSYLAVPVMMAFYAVGFIWKRKLPQRASEIDLDSGRKSWLTADEMNAWRLERSLAPRHIRVYRMLFSN
ncbi:amino-acid permease inda1 [Cylindrobasidium torrendii FP15055 ss-10]|uniref:Amino-acid permease inda1 n=1 Tax=Cylindrobasidium torrendii FP15055 ss-10 TaxID=1314674 RepID=A0A0D7B7G2_9AGAR|nr:amino-acid permease inda1 [Cylindrobasidium torrendii FP15055 ss-10]